MIPLGQDRGLIAWLQVLGAFCLFFTAGYPLFLVSIALPFFHKYNAYQ